MEDYLQSKRMTEPATSAKDKQIGGDHYTKYPIQPREYGIKNNLSYDLTNALKYMTRHKDKHGKQDLLKAIHCIELEIEECYPDEI